MFRLTTFVLLIVSVSLYAQTSTTSAGASAPAVEVKRKAADSVLPDPAAKTFVDTFDFDANVKALQGSQANGDGTAPAPQNESGSPTVAVPPGYRPPSDVALSSTAQQAVQFSATWRAQQNAAAPGPDGRVLFAFGAGLPTVVCAPLRVCLIELQPGEKLVGEPQIGDSVRWNVSPATYGKGDDSTAVLVLKPQMPGLDTNLFITTDRRAYYVRLVSKADDYVSRVAFVYNDDDGGKKWKEHFAEQKRDEAAASHAATPATGSVVAADHLHFDYRIKGGDENLRPQRVFDDGAKTYIQMSAKVANREAPVLVVIGRDGRGEMVNYRVKDQVYIVDRLFERAELLLGSGKKAQKVEINREHRG